MRPVPARLCRRHGYGSAQGRGRIIGCPVDVSRLSVSQRKATTTGRLTLGRGQRKQIDGRDNARLDACRCRTRPAPR